MNFVTQRILTPMQTPDRPNDTPEPFHSLKSLAISGDPQKKEQQKKSQSNQTLCFFENPQADS